MPYKKTKLSGNNKGKVRVSGPSGVHAKATTPKKAEAQMRLLQAVEHGFKSGGKKSKSKIKKKK
ncbi:hypothetical protein A3K80_04410 [Candidatus Bathyarchaeota archaeon RBG_13_38_9]|nr:MAG: hypothetical protein A3K80_04410 [Candidatus Bathyarchaeota archaeon RBG_13_38_9]